MPIEIKVKQGKTLSGQENQAVAMLKAVLERRDKLMREKRAQQQQEAQQQGQTQAQPQQPQQTPPPNPKP